MLQPLGFHDEENPKHVCRLKKSLYGLKQSPRDWFKCLCDYLVNFGFQECLANSSLFILNDCQTYLLVYVDDIVITSSSNSSTERIISLLQNEFSIKDLGDLTFFLGIHVARLLEGMFLSQQQYVVNLLHDEGLDNLKPASIPMEPRLDLSQSTTAQLSHHDTMRYQRILGNLQYLTTTKPDICFAVSKLPQFFSSPTQCHWKALQRVLQYVFGNPFAGILLWPTTSTTVTMFSDANWAGDASDRKSRGGFVGCYGENVISWQLKKQPTVFNYLQV